MKSAKFRLVAFSVVIASTLLMLYLHHCCSLFEDSKYSSGKLKQLSKKSIIYERKDWHNWNFIEYEKTRRGPGENGEAYVLTDQNDIELNRRMNKIQGLSAVASDRISVNRSIPDTRNTKCKVIKYLKHLPATSVIVIFHNEHLSILLRTLHSIYNRTPHELLHEILLVNDASTNIELYEELENYVKNNFDSRVKIINLEERKGLIVTRMEGARNASGEVLVFLDSHIEVNVNWLPPLLEPIVLHPKTSTVPEIDMLRPENFEYLNGGLGSRGVFDWSFFFHCIPRRPEDLAHPEKPAPTPIMLGCAFAIRRDYFFHLGGYDEQLKIWNGENYELSFKLWLCGGQLLEVPCSRISHVFRNHNEYRKMENFDFVAYNFKRIAEVWLDDYKQYLYRSEPERYAGIDAGDLTKEKSIKRNLNCKPFQYMLDHVMPDMLERFPFDYQGNFASGAIQSEADLKLCLDFKNSDDGVPIELLKCSRNLTHPKFTQDFIFSWHRQIKQNDHNEICFEAQDTCFWDCQYKLGSQLWIYNYRTRQLINPPNLCLTANIKKNRLKMRPCREGNIHQKWRWGYLNESAVLNWKTFGVPIPDSILSLSETQTSLFE